MQSVSLEEPRVVEPFFPVESVAAANTVDCSGDPVPPKVHGRQQPRAAPGGRVVVLPGPRNIAKLYR